MITIIFIQFYYNTYLMNIISKDKKIFIILKIIIKIFLRFKFNNVCSNHLNKLIMIFKLNYNAYYFKNMKINEVINHYITSSFKYNTI